MVRPITALVFCSLALAAQPVRVPRAQALADQLMAKHPEMQTIGIHLTPPGWTDDVNIACSKPGKVGKLSANLDLEVARTGQPSLRVTPLGAYDMGLPLQDAAGNKLGMVVIVIRPPSDPATARKQAAAIRDELQTRIPSAPALLEGATLPRTPFALIAQTPLPGMLGEFASLAADEAHDRLYAAAPTNGSVEVFDLAGERRPAIQGLRSPHALAYDAASNRLFVIGPSECVMVDTRTLAIAKRIPLPIGNGPTVFDPVARLFYIATNDSIAILSTTEAKLVGGIALHASSLALSPTHLFAYLPGRGNIVAISLHTHKVESFKPALATPGALAVDPRTSRVFYAPEPADNLWFDRRRDLFYGSSKSGISIYARAVGEMHLLNRFPTMQARTSLFLPAANRLYAIHGTNPDDGAALEVYRVQ